MSLNNSIFLSGCFVTFSIGLWCIYYFDLFYLSVDKNLASEGDELLFLLLLFVLLLLLLAILLLPLLLLFFLSWVPLAIYALVQLRRWRIPETPRVLWAALIIIMPYLGAIALLIVKSDEIRDPY